MKICPNCSTIISQRKALWRISDSSLKWYQVKEKVKHNYFQCKKCDQKLNQKGRNLHLIPGYIGIVLILIIISMQYPENNYALMGLVAVTTSIISYLVHRKFTTYEKRN